MEPKNSSTSVAPGQYGDIQSRSVTRQDSSDNRPVSGASRARSFHERTSSVESVSARPSSRQGTSAHGMAATASVQQLSTGVRLEPRTVNIPSRGTADSNKRVNTPSPLSKPVISNDMSAPRSFQSPVRAAEGPEAADTPSPAAQHLAALSDKDLNKGMKSRLRRAFSFGSAAELRKASAENNLSAERARLRKEKYNDERAAEQEAVVQRQEAAGIGAGIYSGQGGFTGSTDNLSISSTASSASMMLRKMGKGMKKSSRSIKGLFRPKSVVGVPAADGPVHSSMAQVSLVTVEAEREKVNVNLHPADQIGGGTGFPKLERNSIDAASAAASEARGSHDGAESLSRRSIVGSDKDRAEVLAAVKKGILKRSGTGSGSSSPVNLPVDMRSTDSGLSSVPHSPTLSAPTTPVSDQRRTASMTAKTADYFAPRFALSVNKSMPSTPQGLSRNITFSPRIQFHDAWSSTEYDRRGDIATCNRLTPMLAQQIKEELNSFKMEMEVHELSKPHTHFF
ncbi:bud neck involved protein [Cryomyces antarcticus]|nr:bud neck involved protein [Cryomyces antarcticus]